MSYPTTTTDVYTCDTTDDASADGAACAVSSDFSGLAVVDVVAIVGATDILCARLMATVLRRGGGTTQVLGLATIYSHCTDAALTDYEIGLASVTDDVLAVSVTGQTGYHIDWDTKLVVFYTDEVA